MTKQQPATSEAHSSQPADHDAELAASDRPLSPTEAYFGHLPFRYPTATRRYQSRGNTLPSYALSRPDIGDPRYDADPATARYASDIGRLPIPHTPLSEYIQTARDTPLTNERTPGSESSRCC